jgi:putative ABC transport system substrate-binding protein
VLVCTIAGILAAPAVAFAQPAGRRAPKRVAICLGPSNAADPIGPTRQWYANEFARHGLVDGKDIEIVILRSKSSELDDRVAAVRQAVKRRADVILTHGHGHYAKKFFLPVTRDIPLVLWGNDDGSEDSIEMLNRRGENVTGALYSYLDLVLKRFEIMRELRPGAKRAALVMPASREPPTDWQKRANQRDEELLATGARKLGLEFSPVVLPRNVSAEAMVGALRDARIDLVEIQFFFYSSPEIWEALAANGIAASGIVDSAKAGALLSGWTVGFVESAIRLAAKVVRGERATAIPVERSMQFGLAINLRTARKLGIAVPPSLLLRAEEVFE